MDYFGKIANGEDYLSGDWTWRDRLLRQRQNFFQETRIPQRSAYTYGLESFDPPPAPSAVRCQSPTPVLCGNCCRQVPNPWMNGPDDDVMIRALPDLTDVTHYRMPGLSNTYQTERLDYLTSRRYPYNHTMTDLIDDIRRDNRVEARTPAALVDPLAPRVVETTFYDTWEPPRMRRANSLDNIYVPKVQERLRTWDRPESVYEKPPTWYARQRNEEFPLKGSYHTNFTPYAPYKHVHNDYPIYRREARPMWRYVYETKPYHSVRELEMDRIMKAKYLDKYFGKKPKPAKPKREVEIVAQPKDNALVVPDREPFRRAFAVNGLQDEAEHERQLREHPAKDKLEVVVKPTTHNAPTQSEQEEQTEQVKETEEAEPSEQEEKAGQVEQMVSPEQSEQTEEPVELEVSEEKQTCQETQEPESLPTEGSLEEQPVEETQVATEATPEELAPNEKEVEDQDQVRATEETDGGEPQATDEGAHCETVDESEPAREEVDPEPDAEAIKENPEISISIPEETENVPPPSEPEPEVEEINEQEVEQQPEVVAEELNDTEVSHDPEVENHVTEEQLEEQQLNGTQETTDDIVDEELVPDDHVEVGNQSEIEETSDESQSRLVIEEENHEAEDETELELEPEAGEPLPESGVKFVKTGQILIEETDLGNDECIRTEYEIEEVEITE